MTRVGLLSDTHGTLNGSLWRLFDGVDLILHAGDWGDYGPARELAMIAPVEGIRGNVDALHPSFPDVLMVDVGGLRVHLRHRVDIDLGAMGRIAAHTGADMVLFGHTHRPFLRRVGPTVFVNPGSTSRSRGGPNSAGMLVVDEGEMIVTVRNLELADFPVLARWSQPLPQQAVALPLRRVARAPADILSPPSRVTGVGPALTSRGGMEDTTVRFKDRREAGAWLADELIGYSGLPDVVLLALPRGGVPVAYEIARKLRAPLDVFTVRKLGMPGHEELAIGAIASGGIRVLNEPLVDALGVSPATIEEISERERRELERRERVYRGDRPEPDVRHRTVIVVDDGLATGASMHAAVHALRTHSPARVVVAVPVAAPDALHDLGAEVSDVICAIQPEPFFAVGMWYDEFPQVTDDEVRDLLQRAAEELSGR